MSNFLKRFLKYIFRPFHRLWLWTSSSYRRHRTAYQKRFDLKLQYAFIGCLIGMLAVAFVLYIRPHSPKNISEVIQEEESLQELLPMISQEPALVLDEVVSPDVSDEEITPQIVSTEQDIQTIELVLNKNETLSGLLKRADVSLGEALEACKVLELVFDLKKFQAGQNFEVFFIEDSFQGLKFEDRNGQTISVLKNKKGEFIPQTKEGIIENKYFALQGFLTDSFSVSAQKIGIPKAVVHQVDLALDGKIDFKKDLKLGDPFKIIYEQKMTETGKLIGKSQLLYVSLTTKKGVFQRYFFIDATGVQGYYDEKGKSTSQVLAKKPLGNVPISSPFGMRLHPILGYQIQHKGIDFAAKMGTPVPAGGDGVIQRIGRNGGYGKYIQIKHNGTYSTAYGHLSNFASGLHVGSHVKKGEIIGYVGNTGRSTGPHLHYEVVKNDQPVNPLKTYVIPQRVLKNQSLEQFKQKKKMIDTLQTTVIKIEESQNEVEKEVSSAENVSNEKEPSTPTKPVSESESPMPAIPEKQENEKIEKTAEIRLKEKPTVKKQEETTQVKDTKISHEQS